MLHRAVRTTTRRVNIVKKPALRHYSRVPAGLNLTEDFGIGPDGIPETIVIPGIAGEYATNFFKDSYKRGGTRVAAAFEVELNVLTLSVRGDSDWDVVTTSPFFSFEQKEQAIRDKCKSLKLSPFFTNRIVSLLKTEPDITRLEQIRADYEELMRSFRRERQVVLVTGASLSPAELEFFKHSLKVNYLGSGDQMVFSHQVDPTITGGLRIVIDGNTYDHAWTEKTISDVRSEFESDGQDQLKVKNPPAFTVDQSVFATVTKYLGAAFSKDEVQQISSFVTKH